MTKRYLEDIDFLLTTDKQIRFNKRQNRLYLDIDWESQDKDQYIVLDCYRVLDPSTFTNVYNDSFLKRYFEDIDFLLTTDKQIRFNKRQNRLYLDIDWGSQDKDQYIILDCYRVLDPSTFTNVYNDSFLKRYCTALIKKQWGQNLIKFRGVKLPGGIEFNGREIYQDGVEEVNAIRDQMSSTYELPPLDMIG